MRVHQLGGSQLLGSTATLCFESQHLLRYLPWYFLLLCDKCILAGCFLLLHVFVFFRLLFTEALASPVGAGGSGVIYISCVCMHGCVCVCARMHAHGVGVETRLKCDLCPLSPLGPETPALGL